MKTGRNIQENVNIKCHVPTSVLLKQTDFYIRTRKRANFQCHFSSHKRQFKRWENLHFNNIVLHPEKYTAIWKG
jgi:hypothetical protein